MLQLLVPHQVEPRGRARRIAGVVLKIAKTGIAAAETGYAVAVARSWLRFGRSSPAHGDDADPLLDRYMPVADVVERHQIRIEARPEVVFATACETDPNASAVVRLIFQTRAFVLGAPTGQAWRGGLLEQTQALGWRMLALKPGREIVMGAVTQPWKSDVVFRGLPADEFADFHEAGYVKIAWTLRVDPIGESTSILRTETRAVATDPAARRRFRWYWARFSPGIILIRRLLLRAVKRTAERRAR